MRLPSWTPCLADPDDFDCSDCEIGWDPCALRADGSRRHFRAARARIRAGGTDESLIPSSEVAHDVAEFARGHRLSLPVSLLRGGVRDAHRDRITDSELAAVLRTSDHFVQTSPGMFKWVSSETTTIQSRHDVPLDLSSGAELARLAVRSTTMEPGDQRRAFKRLAGLRHASAFDSRPAALRTLNLTIDDLAPAVLAREGWSAADAQYAAVGPDAVSGKAKADDELNQRSLLLSSIQAIELLACATPPDLAVELRDARNDLASANLRLALSVAEAHAHGGFLELVDLFQVGAIGLLKGIEGFDPYRGFAFSTYATWWVRQSITRVLADEPRTIRIPVHMVEAVNRLGRVTRDLGVRLGREPTLPEVADAMSAGEEVAMTPERVAEVTRLTQEVASLDALLSSRRHGNVAAGLGDFLPASQSTQPEQRAIEESALEAVTRLLGRLTARERRVIDLRFGFDGGGERTLQQVGLEFDLTRERIRQIEARALRKLQRPASKGHLDEYVRAPRRTRRPKRQVRGSSPAPSAARPQSRVGAKPGATAAEPAAPAPATRTPGATAAEPVQSGASGWRGLKCPKCDKVFRTPNGAAWHRENYYPKCAR